MLEAAPAYRKFSRSGRSWLVQSARLWAADGHLLQVTSLFGFERYRRFYFHEMEAYYWRGTPLRAVWNWIFGVALGLSLFFGAVLLWQGRKQHNEGLLVLAALAAIVAAVGAVGVLWNSLLGPTCDAYLQTRSGLDRLPMLRRERHARALLAQLRPLAGAPAARVRQPA